MVFAFLSTSAPLHSAFTAYSHSCSFTMSPHTPFSSSGSPNHRSTTASQLLAAFSPKSQPKIASASTPSADRPKYNIKMTQPPRDLRRNKYPISYIISDDSEDSSQNTSSAFSTPQKPIVYLEEEEEYGSEPEPLNGLHPRQSSAGHSLRQRSDLHLSLRAQENADKRVRKRKSKPKRQPQIQRSVIAPTKTARNEIREEVNNETAAKRANFFVAKKEYFLPLLPEGNYVQRLVDQRQLQHVDAEASCISYEALSTQPQGVKAKMKPYQLSGVSFLVYLHRNGYVSSSS